MYIIEAIFKYIKGYKKFSSREKFDPFAQENLENSEECEHMFLPVDSSGETFACSKCGLLVNKKDLKDKNIFKQ